MELVNLAIVAFNDYCYLYGATPYEAITVLATFPICARTLWILRG
jgi:hypothetical protein